MSGNQGTQMREVLDLLLADNAPIITRSLRSSLFLFDRSNLRVMALRGVYYRRESNHYVSL